MFRVTIITILLSCGLLFFNNCSDVGFSQKVQDPSVGGQGGGGGGGGGEGCAGIDCLTRTEVSKTLSATAPEQINKVDVLLIIDNSNSMRAEINELARRMASFVTDLENRGLDWQICHYTTQLKTLKDTPASFKPAEAIPWAGTSEIVLNSALFQQELTRGNDVFADSMNAIPLGIPGASQEEGIAATYDFINKRSNDDCFRTDAALAAVVLSDEDERGHGRDPRYTFDFKNEPVNLVAAMWQRFGPEVPFTFHSIVIEPTTNPNTDTTCYKQQFRESESGNDVFYGKVYAELSAMTYGTLGDICSDNYSAQLNNIAAGIDRTLDYISLECEPVPGSLSINGMNSSEYNVQGNKVIFTPSLGEGQSVTGSYKCYEYQ